VQIYRLRGVSARHENYTSLHGMFIDLQTPDVYPICGRTDQLMEIEPHPDRSGLEIHGYSCAFCGPVMSQVVTCSVEEEPKPFC
jgi:hypothetical protein